MLPQRSRDKMVALRRETRTLRLEDQVPKRAVAAE